MWAGDNIVDRDAGAPKAAGLSGLYVSRRSDRILSAARQAAVSV
jgi:hypothetical protein